MFFELSYFDLKLPKNSDIKENHSKVHSNCKCLDSITKVYVFLNLRGFFARM